MARAEGPEQFAARAEAVETVVRDLLQMVVIDLSPDENAQEIFETLNARGAQLTAADLIKNFVFQRLLESDGTSRRPTRGTGRISRRASGRQKSALAGFATRVLRSFSTTGSSPAPAKRWLPAKCSRDSKPYG